MSHTPGPWKADGPHNFSGTLIYYIRAPISGDLRYGREVAQTRNNEGNEQEAQANAHLIASAPVLDAKNKIFLEALELIVDQTCESWTANVAREAIAKVKS